jgi:hypothetical protein
MRPELPTAVAVDNSASIQPARSIFISWGKSVQISGATSQDMLGLSNLDDFMDYFVGHLGGWTWQSLANPLFKTVRTAQTPHQSIKI